MRPRSSVKPLKFWPKAVQGTQLRTGRGLQAVTVQQGDTLWAISDTVYGDGLLFVRVFEANRDQIRNPDLIYPGQIFNSARIIRQQRRAPMTSLRLCAT